MHIALKSNRRVPKLDIWKPGEAIIDFDVGQLKTAETRVRLEVANTVSSKRLQLGTPGLQEKAGVPAVKSKCSRTASLVSTARETT
jgi:hypothetical protein